VGLAVYTLVTSITDLRFHRIPNKVTVSMFAVGWVYQLVFAGLAGLGDGALGFLAGFGILFGLWMIGVGGGGDVKLMGGLGVWLGWQLTLYVLAVSVIYIILGTILVLCITAIRKGFASASKELSDEADGPKDGQGRPRVMAFAIPVALAVWTIVGWSAFAQITTG